jgi:uncharacterized membrane protein (DUF106 family)
MGFVFGGMALMSVLAIPVGIIIFAWLRIKEKIAMRTRTIEPTVFSSWTSEEWQTIAREMNAGSIWK